eukprot:g14508.t1
MAIWKVVPSVYDRPLRLLLEGSDIFPPTFVNDSNLMCSRRPLPTQSSASRTLATCVSSLDCSLEGPELRQTATLRRPLQLRKSQPPHPLTALCVSAWFVLPRDNRSTTGGVDILQRLRPGARQLEFKTAGNCCPIDDGVGDHQLIYPRLRVPP